MPPPDPGSSTTLRLRDRLKLETAALHEAAEAAMDLPRRLADRTAYGNLLGRLWRLHAACEDGLARVDLSSRRFPAPTMERSAWLAQDLTTVGVAAPLVRPAARTSLDAATAVGMVYVLEGSTLGGRVVLKRVQTGLGLGPEGGARFFHGYGVATGARWRAVAAALDEVEDAEHASVTLGARITFEAFIAALA